MAKGFGKFLLTVTALGVAAAGAYYYLEKNGMLPKNALRYNPDDEDEDFDHFEDDDLEKERSYFTLDPEEGGNEGNGDAPAGDAPRTEEYFNDETKEEG
ncbi:MAG: hypothetical protein K5641_05880 [Lachnospiraceae bacterium]|nr:hypothetical protein [Lachnospiraceae bacterium]